MPSDLLHTLPPATALDALLAALENAGLGCTVVLAREDGSFERAYANEAAARIAGVDADAMMKITPMDLLPPDERARLAAMHTAGTAPRAIRTTVRRADGTLVPVDVGLGSAAMEGAEAVFVFMLDATPTAQIEAALRESEERFRRLAEASPDAITMVANGRYVYANPVALRHLGISSLDERAPLRALDIVPPDRHDAVRERLRRLDAGERVAPLQTKLTSPTGEERTLETSTVITTVGGKRAVISTTRDITDRVRLQAELMTKDRLASLGTLAAGIGHELNNPLMAVAIQARRLLDSADRLALPAEVNDSLAQIDEAAQRMRMIIADLLFLARSSDQPQTHVDVTKVLSSTLTLLRAGLGAGVRIASELPPLPPIRGWSSKLGQVFLNILQNAVQAVAGRANGEIRIGAREAKGAIEVVVEDNGVGIPPETIPHVATPFFTTKPGGVGLGLWISQTLVEQHGGRLALASTPGAGTTVTITLPTDGRE